MALSRENRIAAKKAESSIPEEPSLPDVPVQKMQLRDDSEADPISAANMPTRDRNNDSIKAPETSIMEIDFTTTAPKKQGRRRSSLQALDLTDIRKQLHSVLKDSSATNLLPAGCCGGGCCKMGLEDPERSASPSFIPVVTPNSQAFERLNLELKPLSRTSKLMGVTELPSKKIEFETLSKPARESHKTTVDIHPPAFVTPHPPYNVFSTKIHHARLLSADDAEKHTYHFDLDVTDYPEEAPGVDFRVGGAIGVCAPNEDPLVDEIFDILGVPDTDRDEPVSLHTPGGRWPTIWGEEEKRSLTTTRRELLTWTVDIQSYAPTKNLLRVLAEYADNEDEKKILLYLCSRQGQAAFCELRTGPYVTLHQLLNAFPSSRPPLEHLLPNLQALMPRFYSLSSDPHVTRHAHRRTIEIAVTVHKLDDWSGTKRTGVASGYMERMARKFIENNENSDSENGESEYEFRIPMFRGLMENPMAKEFRADGPMLLIGAGVGVAPFRGFVQRRLQNASCANKVWVLQGIRDSLLDELYAGEWGAHENDIKKVVESRKGTKKYVQDEVLAQADLVWFIINSLDGRVFVCGSSKGMGEGVQESLVKVAMDKGNLREEEAKEFWDKKKASYHYVTETW